MTGAVVWFTGLSGSGKSTLAQALHGHLRATGRAAHVLDGDALRRGLSRDLDFSPAARSEHLRRTAAVAALFADAGLVAIVACISPTAADRADARAAVAPHPFLEVHLCTTLAICEARDPKGLYRRARAGALPGFTGIDAPYDPPTHPDLRLDTGVLDVATCVARLAATVQHLAHHRQLAIRPSTPQMA